MVSKVPSLVSPSSSSFPLPSNSSRAGPIPIEAFRQPLCEGCEPAACWSISSTRARRLRYWTVSSGSRASDRDHSSRSSANLPTRHAAFARRAWSSNSAA